MIWIKGESFSLILLNKNSLMLESFYCIAFSKALKCNRFIYDFCSFCKSNRVIQYEVQNLFIFIILECFIEIFIILWPIAHFINWVLNISFNVNLCLWVK